LATGLIIPVGLRIPVNDKQPSSKEIGKVDSVFATAIFFLTFSGEVFFATESTENSEQIFLFFYLCGLGVLCGQEIFRLRKTMLTGPERESPKWESQD